MVIKQFFGLIKHQMKDIFIFAPANDYKK